MRRAVIKSWGAVTVFGNLRETWDALLSGKAIHDHTRVPTIDGSRRAELLARMAVSQLDPFQGNYRTALVVGTSKGSIEDWFDEGPRAAGLGDIAFELSRGCALRGPILTLSAACASGLYALARATMMIEAGEVDRALVVATEASVHPLFIGSFQRLGILAKPGEGCRPFGKNRSGFYMSEAAAAVLLEADSAGEIAVERFALGGDATHLTGNDVSATVLKHLLMQVIDGRGVDLIHAHGTGTQANDEMELSAIEGSLSSASSHPTLYSHKAALGHSLGASGLLSVVLNCMSHRHGIIPPNPNTVSPLPAGQLSICNTAVAHPIRRSLAIASGFGGATAVVSLVSNPDV
jgi:3-oxoacyl-[acyl-carrier-protein] synthase II